MDDKTWGQVSQDLYGDLSYQAIWRGEPDRRPLFSDRQDGMKWKLRLDVGDYTRRAGVLALHKLAADCQANIDKTLGTNRLTNQSVTVTPPASIRKLASIRELPEDGLERQVRLTLRLTIRGGPLPVIVPEDATVVERGFEPGSFDVHFDFGDLGGPAANHVAPFKEAAGRVCSFMEEVFLEWPEYGLGEFLEEMGELYAARAVSPEFVVFGAGKVRAGSCKLLAPGKVRDCAPYVERAKEEMTEASQTPKSGGQNRKFKQMVRKKKNARRNARRKQHPGKEIKHPPEENERTRARGGATPARRVLRAVLRAVLSRDVAR